MSFNEVRFPTTISAGAKFGPSYSTTIATNIGGYEASNANWSYPLHTGDVAFGVRTQAQLDDLLAFFHAVGGRANGFRFKNFNDHTATAAQGTLTAIDSTHWQMTKTYTYGSISRARKITKPCAGVTISGGGTYTYSTTTGIITKSAGADPTAWAGEFDFPVRFDTDKMLPESLTLDLYDWSAIPIVELRL
jgi:uncharacterized protein (TIGR02217 family)